MKFLLALDNFSRGTGGAPASARELAAALLERGHQLAIVECGRRSELADWHGAMHWRVRLHSALLPSDRDLRTLVLHPRWRRTVEDLLASFDPDLLLTQGMLAPGALEAARAAGVPSAYFFRGYAPLCPEQFVGLDPEECRRPDCAPCLSLARRLKGPLVRAALELYDRTIPRADLLVANSRYVAGLLERFWKVRAEVVYPTLSLPVAAEPANDPNGYVLFVKPQRAKGLDVFLSLAAAFPDRQFAVAGETSGSAADLIAGMPNIRALGWQDDMAAVYRKARALVVPSLLPEPFGRAVAEAAAFGVPTIAFRRGGLPEAVGAGGVLLDPGAAGADWTRALESLDDPARYEELRRAALESARRISAEGGPDRLAGLLARTAAAGVNLPPPQPDPGRRLKVVHIVGAVPLGGAELSVFHLLSRMSRERFDVELVCLRAEGALAERFRAAGVPLTLLNLPSRYSPLGLLRLARFLASRGADAVHTHMRRANTSGRIAAWMAGVPVILAHERSLPHDKTWRHRLVDRLLARLSSRVIAVSPQVAEAECRGSGIPAEKLLALPNALDVEEFRPRDRAAARTRLGIAPGEFVAGFAGRLHPIKKLDVFLRAAAAASREIPDLRVLLVGEGPQRGELEALAAELGLAARVTFLGVRSDMPEIYPAMDLLVLVSRVEGCSRTLLEALACGLPAVATPVGYAPELLGREEAGILVPVDDSGATARALVRLSREPETRERMGREARRRAEAQGLDGYVRRVERLYLALWNGRRPG